MTIGVSSPNSFLPVENPQLESIQSPIVWPAKVANQMVLVDQPPVQPRPWRTLFVITSMPVGGAETLLVTMERIEPNTNGFQNVVFTSSATESMIDAYTRLIESLYEQKRGQAAR